MIFLHVPPQEANVPHPRMVFVGEAPSNEEVINGIPLVGPSGRIFNALLHTADLDRDNFAVTNVFDEQLPGNDVANWCVPLAEARTRGLTDLPPIGRNGFLDAPYRWHLQRLADEIARWKPNLIVPLGGSALWAFLGHTNISASRGVPTVATRIASGTKLLPTFHPAAVMHQWKLYTTVARDLVKANRESAYAELRVAKRTLVLEPTIEDVREYVPTLLASDLLSVDIETGFGQITCIGFAPDAERAIVVPFVDRRKPGRSYWDNPQDELEAWKLVREVLASPVPKLGQNFGQYDAFWLLMKKHIAPRNFLHDTRLLHHALYPELPKSLAFLGQSYATQGTWKGWAKRGDKRDDS